MAPPIVPWIVRPRKLKQERFQLCKVKDEVTVSPPSLEQFYTCSTLFQAPLEDFLLRFQLLTKCSLRK
jgi:hypothetical protein